jgi:hypothetical protein
MITLEPKVRIDGEIVTLGEVIEMNELDFDEVAEALTRDGVYRIDAGSNGVSDFVDVTIATCDKQTEWTRDMIADAKLAVAIRGTDADAVVRFYHSRGWTGQFPWHLF